MYTGRLDDAGNGGVVLKPERIAGAKGAKRGVLWADLLYWYETGGERFVYFHTSPYIRATYRGFADTTALRGQHRAWSDGSVEWVEGSMIDTARDASAKFNKTATYKVPDYYYWWF